MPIGELSKDTHRGSRIPKINAAKYGALSNGIGNVHVAWAVAGESTLLTWMEVGGPPAAAPKRKGFGSLLIEESFRGDQESCFDYRRTGLICVLALGDLPQWVYN